MVDALQSGLLAGRWDKAWLNPATQVAEQEQLALPARNGTPGSRAVRGNAGTAVNELPNEHGIIEPLGSVETVMEASLCPMCSRALQISTIEPHPTRDGVDVVTRRCPIHGDIWRSAVVNKVEAADIGHRDAAAATTR